MLRNQTYYDGSEVAKISPFKWRYTHRFKLFNGTLGEATSWGYKFRWSAKSALRKQRVFRFNEYWDEFNEKYWPGTHERVSKSG